MKDEIQIEGYTLKVDNYKTLVEWLNAIDLLLAKGKTFQAYDLVKLALNQYQDSLELKQKLALTLLRTGSIKDVVDILKPLKVDDEETIGLLAKAYKEIWKRTNLKKDALICKNMYEKSYNKDSNRYWTGINTAMMSIVVNNKKKATNIAIRIIDTCKLILKKNNNDENKYWIYATIGEAYLIIGENDEAIYNYTKAYQHINGCYDKVISSSQQLRLIYEFKLLNNFNEKLFVKLKNILKSPVIAVFTGHMIDYPDRQVERFPFYLEHDIRKEIDKKIEMLNIKIGYSAAACGADIIFLEAMIEKGNEVNILLPFAKADFIDISIRYAGKNWIKRFNKVLKMADSVKYTTNENYMEDDSLFVYHNNLLNGHAFLRANYMQTKPYMLAVNEPESNYFKGGTNSNIKDWPIKDRIEIINIKNIRENNSRFIQKLKENKDRLMNFSNSVSDTEIILKPKNKTKIIKRKVYSMLFADIVNYSKLNELDYPNFNKFLNILSLKLEEIKIQPDKINTWGDAIFVVMDSAYSIVQYALQLKKFFTEFDFKEIGLTKKLEIRIALHSGPTFEFIDPLTKRTNLYGTHVNRTARLEPVTLRNHIFATEQFATQLVSEEINKKSNFDKINRNYEKNNYALEYAGVVDLAKNFDKQIVYHIRNRTESEMNRIIGNRF